RIGFVCLLAIAGCLSIKAAYLAAESGAAGQISQFNDSKLDTPMGGAFMAVDDKANQGSSVAIMAFVTNAGARGSKYYLKLTGNVTTKFKYGFIGISCDFQPGGSAMDISGFKGFKFYVKGDGKSYN